ncbi:MAG: hypothetical protein HY619_03055 [Thaumarchaeota archaeon]|nr:hypothetical protein [Nitrososphaerota archaeon]
MSAQIGAKRVVPNAQQLPERPRGEPGTVQIEKPGDLQSYVYVKTPLFLISEYAFECSRRYKKIDNEFLQYCKALNAVKLDFSEQIVTRQYYAFALPHNLILLRDGERVEPLKTIPSYQGRNPFLKLDEALRAKINAIASQSLQAYPLEYRQAIEGLLRISNTTNDDVSPTIAITEFDNVYSISQLQKPGTYDIVIRTFKTYNIIGSMWDDREVRYRIDFKKFR